MSALELPIDPNAIAKMPYISFKRVPVQDKEKTLEAGHYVAVDVDYINVTQPGGTDVFEQKVDFFFDQCQRDMNNGRLPAEWLTAYRRKYEAWKNGQEIPVDGTPIRGWPVISPAQQETLIRLNILTVEALSSISADAVKRVGIGGADLKNKAKAWLKQIKQAGKLTLEYAELQKENETLKGSLAALEEKIKLLEQQISSIKADESASVSK